MHPFFVIYKAVLVICLYELLGNPTTQLNEPPGPLGDGAYGRTCVKQYDPIFGRGGIKA